MPVNRFRQKSEIIIWVASVLLLLLIYILPNSGKNVIICLGIITILVAIIQVFYYRKCDTFMFLVVTIAIINICWAFSVCLTDDGSALSWQQGLIDLSENVIAVKNNTVFYIAMFLGLGGNYSYGNIKTRIGIDQNPHNFEVFLGCLAIMMVALLYGYDRSVIGQAGYVSNGSPLYEYAVLVFIIAWSFTGDRFSWKICLILYALFYCFQSLIYGDRSACFPMIIACFMLMQHKKIRPSLIILCCLLGIIGGNAIDISRNDIFLFSPEGINALLRRGLHVNTFSYSHYAGVQIIRYSNESTNNLWHLVNCLSKVILGGTSEVDLAKIATDNGYFNRGGSMSANYFYYWGGIVGVMIGGWCVGHLLKIVYTRVGKIMDLLRLTVLIFAIRWYVYFPIPLLRTAIAIPLFIMFVINLFRKYIGKVKYGGV